MRSILRLLLAAGLAATFGCLAFAADIEGILIDKMCAPKIVQAKDQKAAAAHTRACGLMPDCAEAGYGVFTADGKYITFDAAGNQKAQAALKASTKKDDIRVKVTGAQSGETIKVSSIKIL